MLDIYCKEGKMGFQTEQGVHLTTAGGDMRNGSTTGRESSVMRPGMHCYESIPGA